jgi:putative hemin transport protein
METTITPDLRQRWNALLETNPKLRIRNAARELNVSELQLLVTKIGESVTRLDAQWADFLKEIPRLGYVQALSRNEWVVHERKGTYKNYSVDQGGRVVLFVSEDIDLRIFITNWKYGFAVEEFSRGKLRKSFQFFDASGEAMHKIYLLDESNEPAFEEIKDRYRSDDQSRNQLIASARPEAPELPDSAIDVETFQKEWLDLKDTHDFYPLLMKHRLKRTQAMRLAPPGPWAKRVDNGSLRKIFTTVADRQVPIMVFVGNAGIVQIHTGLIHNLQDHEGFYNVLDPTFNLHIMEDKIEESWVVRKPSVDGIVTSLELFDRDGMLMATIFGKRKPGIPELQSWREVIDAIAT